ncbi:DUF3310 domain-containing protein [Chenggangzhangella methanolivorans]|uniref:DUF3310 domain-containing protein n=1 Tax=Chenggangzhangella methanolivorans TaxID=1437009 RepID=A0A9E6UKM3_9HYPH|nr:DUF3310 domain-containing protein [Chenggangzhangella methanolivorans]QZN99506.1 DUF3310 domain-containing protein [Chenggangzhangella methanolivorans]
MSSAVNSPSHYRRGGFELAQVIDAFELDRWETQAAQYLFRAKHKDGGAHEAQDLAKTIAFLIHALTLKSPATLERFEAFGFRLTRGGEADVDFQPARIPPLTRSTALSLVSLEDTLEAFLGESREVVLEGLTAALALQGRLRPSLKGSVGDQTAGLPEDDPAVSAICNAAEAIAHERVIVAARGRAS